VDGRDKPGHDGLNQLSSGSGELSKPRRRSRIPLRSMRATSKRGVKHREPDMSAIRGSCLCSGIKFDITDGLPQYAEYSPPG
jgi:hypothetical protein